MSTMEIYSQNQWVHPINLNHDNDLVPSTSLYTLDCDQSSPDFLNKYNRYQFYLDNYAIHPVVTIPIQFVFWQKDDGTGNWTNDPSSISRLNQIIAWLNNIYTNNCTASDPIPGVQHLQDTKIRFEAKYTFIPNTTMWGSGESSTLNNAYYQAFPSDEKKFLIHVTAGSYGDASGYTISPNSNFSLQHFIVTFNNEADPMGDYGFAVHLAHELAHDLDLFHTYENIGCNQNSLDYLSDVFNYGPCPQNAGWDCNVLSNTNTCTNNIMGGTAESCNFSPMQIARMHRALALKSIREYVKCEDYNASSITVNTNETWDFNIKFYNPLVVKNNATLTIQCIVKMSQNHGIDVKESSNLILDGGKLTSSCNNFWDGITVWGDAFAPQNQLYQSYLTTKNDAVIENSRNAIRTIGYDQDENLDWLKTGAVINCSNTIFRNNWRSAEFLYYHSQHPTNPSVEILNQSKFTNCDFIWDDYYFDSAPLAALTLYHVNGIIVKGCNFIDNRTNVTASNRTIGIKSIDAGYKVIGEYIGTGSIYPLNFIQPDNFSDIDYNVNHFKNLKCGLHAMNFGTFYNLFIDQSFFENNSYGVLIDAVDNAVITRNKFDFNSNHPIDINSMYELSIRESNGYLVEGNLFNKNSSQPATGTLILNSGPQANEIYRNFYDGLNVGNIAKGFNSNDQSNISNATGLQWKCNSNSDGLFDFINEVDSFDPLMNGEGVRLLQGSHTSASGNTFSSNINQSSPINDLHINSLDQDLLGYFHSSASNQIPTEIQGNIALIESPTNYCPSSFNSKIAIGDGKLITSNSITNMYNELSILENSLTSKKSELDSLLDIGNSQYLSNLISSINASNNNQIKAELLSKSPFLSISIIQQLGLVNETLFPNSWLKDIIDSNIEVARNNDLIYFLETKPNPMPQTMINEIKADRYVNFTQRGQKEIEILDLSDKRELILNMMISDAMADSSETNWNVVKEKILFRDNIETKRQIADYFLSRKDIDSCNNMLDVIELQLATYGMDRTRQELEDFVIFKRYLLSITNNTGVIEKLQPEEISQIEYMATNFHGKASRQSRNILCFFENLCEDIQGEIPLANSGSTKSATGNNSYYNLDFQNLKIMPNPNDGIFFAQVPEKNEIGTIQVINISGQEVPFEFAIHEDGKVQLHIMNAVKGVYFVNITTKDGDIYKNRVLVNK